MGAVEEKYRVENGVVFKESPFTNGVLGAPDGDYLSRAILDCTEAPIVDTAFMGLTSGRWIADVNTLARQRRAEGLHPCLAQLALGQKGSSVSSPILGSNASQYLRAPSAAL